MHLEQTVPLDQSVPQPVSVLLETAVDISLTPLQTAPQFQTNIPASNLLHSPMEHLPLEVKLQLLLCNNACFMDNNSASQASMEHITTQHPLLEDS